VPPYVPVTSWLTYVDVGAGQKVTPAPYNDPGLMDPPYNNAGYIEKEGTTTHTGDYSSTGLMAPTVPMKPYDPSDPSTFPTSPAPTSTYVSHDVTGTYGGTSDYQSSGYPPSHGYPPYNPGSPAPLMGSPPPQQRMGGYTGAAEV